MSMYCGSSNCEEKNILQTREADDRAPVRDPKSPTLVQHVCILKVARLVHLHFASLTMILQWKFCTA
jgi:hypothetical protein